jgi:hypothetical protein
MFFFAAANLFLMSATPKDMIYEIKNMSIFGVDYYGPTPNIISLVLAAYVSRY